MTQNDLPQGPPVAMPLAPENDSSGDAVLYGASLPHQTQDLYHQGVVPELTIGSPKAIAQPVQDYTAAPASPSTVTTPTNNPSQYQPQVTATPALPVFPQTIATPAMVMPPAVVQNAASLTAPSPTETWQTVIESPPPPPPVPITPLPPAITQAVQPVAAPTPAVTLPSRTLPPPPPAATPQVELKKEVNKPKAAQPQMIGGAVLEEDEVKPLSVMVIAGLYYLVGGVYGLLGLCLVGLSYLFDNAMALSVPNALSGQFTQFQPLFAVLPTALILAAGLYWFAGLRVKRSSRKGWVTGLFVSLIIPPIIFFVNQFFQPLILRFFDNPQLTSSLPESWLSVYQIIRIIMQGQLAVMVLAGLLLVFFGAFHYQEPAKRKKKPWGFTIAFASLLLVPVGYYGYTGIQNTNSDLGFTKTRQEAGFHIYKPLQLPQEWAQLTTWGVNNAAESLLVGRNDYVQAQFDITLAAKLEGRSAQPITLREVDVPAAFDVQGFAQSVIEGALVSEIQVQRGVGQKGYFIEKTDGSGSVKALAVLTSDNVLLLLSTKVASQNAMVVLANSLD